MYENEWQINVHMTVFTTVIASCEEAANDAASNEIARLMKQTDLQESDYQVLQYETYDFNRVEID